MLAFIVAKNAQEIQWFQKTWITMLYVIYKYKPEKFAMKQFEPTGHLFFGKTDYIATVF